MRSNRKLSGYHEARFWADPELWQDLLEACRAEHADMADLLESIVREALGK